MDFTGLIGFIAGLLLICFGITASFTDLSAIKGFIDYLSIAVTFGGTICSTLIAFPVSFFKKIPAQLKITLQKNKYDPQKYISIIVDLAKEARRRGLLSLEEKANQLEDPFLQSSILLIVDAISPEKVKEMLDSELNNLEDRHAAGWGFYKKASTFALAFGIIGTLIGLIKIYVNGNADTGKWMAALVAIFYGIILYLILEAIGNRLQVRHKEEMFCKKIIVFGITAIQAGESPKQIERQLNLNSRQSIRENKVLSKEA